METFSALLACCAGNSPVTGEFLAQRHVTRSFDVFFVLRLNRQLSKQWRRWWFEMLPRSLCRHCNELTPSDESKAAQGNKCRLSYGMYREVSLPSTVPWFATTDEVFVYPTIAEWYDHQYKMAIHIYIYIYGYIMQTVDCYRAVY